MSPAPSGNARSGGTAPQKREPRGFPTAEGAIRRVIVVAALSQLPLSRDHVLPRAGP